MLKLVYYYCCCCCYYGCPSYQPTNGVKALRGKLHCSCNWKMPSNFHRKKLQQYASISSESKRLVLSHTWCATQKK